MDFWQYGRLSGSEVVSYCRLSKPGSIRPAGCVGLRGSSLVRRPRLEKVLGHRAQRQRAKLGANEDVTPLAGSVVDRQDGEGVNENALNGQPFHEQGWVFVALWCTLSILISYADRTNISTAILQMQQDFGWDDAQKGVVLSMFFLGYALTQVAGGYAADRRGGKGILTAGIIVWSICTFITPVAASAGLGVLLVNRVALGLGEGVAFPAVHSIISANVPAVYQSTVVGVVTAASYGGTVLAFSISPWMIGRYGWESVFYAFGLLATLWLPPWLLAEVRSRPADGEGTVVLLNQNPRSSSCTVENGNSPVYRPFDESGGGKESGLFALLKTRPVLAICIAQYTQSWGTYVLINWLPTFFTDAYGVSVEDIGQYTVLPYIVQAIVGASCGSLADNLIARDWSVKTVRQVFQSVGMLGPAACLFLATSPLVSSSAETCSAIITIGLGLSAFSLAGVSVSHLDVAPNNAGFVFGAANTAATAAGFVGVTSTGWLLKETSSWAWVFGLAGAHYIIGTVIWILWVGGSQLPQDSLVWKKPQGG